MPGPPRLPSRRAAREAAVAAGLARAAIPQARLLRASPRHEPGRIVDRPASQQGQHNLSIRQCPGRARQRVGGERDQVGVHSRPQFAPAPRDSQEGRTTAGVEIKGETPRQSLIRPDQPTGTVRAGHHEPDIAHWVKWGHIPVTSRRHLNAGRNHVAHRGCLRGILCAPITPHLICELVDDARMGGYPDPGYGQAPNRLGRAVEGMLDD